jgi:hypothetical protein
MTKNDKFLRNAIIAGVWLVLIYNVIGIIVSGLAQDSKAYLSILIAFLSWNPLQKVLKEIL